MTGASYPNLLPSWLSMASSMVTIGAERGTLLVSADVHGNLADFVALRTLFLDELAGGRDIWWVSVGDWVHGPGALDRHPVCDRDGAPLYAYADESKQLIAEWFALQDAHPDRAISLCGNHEWSHFGGPRTHKFHRDEASFLEAQLTRDAIDDLRARFASWPIVALVPAIGLVISHGAIKLRPGDRQRLSNLELPRDRDDPIVQTAMFHYGHGDDSAAQTLAELGPPYRVMVHGHDREEEGWAPTSDVSALLCTSFGARRERKAYLWLDLARPLASIADVREGHELRRLFG
jgi:hypothetical protein